MQATTLTNLTLLLFCSMVLFGTWSRALAKAIGIFGLLLIVAILLYLYATLGTIP